MTVDVSCCSPAAAARVSAIARALSDPVRVRILDALRNCDDVCQCDLGPLFDISQPTLSHHLKKLREAGLVEVDRRGKWAHYSVNPESLEVLKSWLS